MLRSLIRLILSSLVLVLLVLHLVHLFVIRLSFAALPMRCRQKLTRRGLVHEQRLDARSCMLIRDSELLFFSLIPVILISVFLDTWLAGQTAMLARERATATVEA